MHGLREMEIKCVSGTLQNNKIFYDFTHGQDYKGNV